jgi:acyl-CoA thioester hydrolase
VHEKRIEIRWRDMDAFRHVNHAVFVTYLEECRDELMAESLHGAGDVEDFFIAHVEIDYRRPLTQDDAHVAVRCGIERLGRSSVRTREEIRTLGGDLAATGTAVMVAVDRATGAARRLTEAERQAFEARIESAAPAAGP